MDNQAVVAVGIQAVVGEAVGEQAVAQLATVVAALDKATRLGKEKLGK